MKAMILAAGRGERLRPLTDTLPKPLLDIGGIPLIGHHLRALAAAGFNEVVINVAYRAGQIMAALGTGGDYGLTIRYSVESPGALDTGGGVRNALSLLGEAPFVLISADVWSDFDYRGLRGAGRPDGVELVLVANPPHHPSGDFGLRDGHLVDAGPRLTYAGIGVYAPALFRAQTMHRFPLVTVIKQALRRGQGRGRQHTGAWIDVGRPADLAAARAAAAQCFRLTGPCW
jgi:MurNAc alpha-1-phosphate uridylyltransferase